MGRDSSPESEVRSRGGSRDRSASPRRPRSRSRSHERDSKSRSPDRRRRNDASRSPSRERRRRDRSSSRDRRSSSRGRAGFTPTTRLHVGDLDTDVTKRELEKIFEKYGELREVFVAKSLPCFAFVVYYNEADAEDACKSVDGMELRRRRMRVTFARPRIGEGDRMRGPRQNINDLRCFSCGGRGHFSRDCGKTNYGFRRRSRSYSRSRSRSPKYSSSRYRDRY